MGQQHGRLLQSAAGARLRAATLGVVVEHVLGWRPKRSMMVATGMWQCPRDGAWQGLPWALRFFLAPKRVMCKYSPRVRDPAPHGSSGDPTATASVQILPLVL